MAAQEDEVLVERTGGIERVTFNRPATLNAFTSTMLTRTARAVDEAGRDADVRVIVLAGAGRAFSAGADLSGRRKEPGSNRIDTATAVTMAIRRAPKPVLAAVNGPAVGVGCSFALAADLAIATESAYFLLAFANIGLMPDGGATALIPTAIGRARALRMAMLAERIPATQAAEWGLIAAAVPDDAFDDEIERLATRLAAGPTVSYANTKRVINANTLAQLPHALEAEREGQFGLLTTEDHAEGIAAFREKRAPQFTGR